HVLELAAQYDSAKDFDELRLRESMYALLRPDPVTVVHVERVADDWHARFSCLGRRYLYRIANRRAPLTLDAGKSWRIGPHLDVGAMREGASYLVGRHDFTTFRSVHCQADSPVKTLDVLSVEREDEEIHIGAEARSFLHHQVRSMTGCLAMVGLGRWEPEDMRKALEAKDRAALGLNAPP